MISKEQYIKSFTHELHCVRHIAGKVTAEMLDYRPTPGQRSMLELLQYLTYAPIGWAEAIAVSPEGYMQRMKNSESVTLDVFQQAMHDQEAEWKSVLENVSDEAMQEEVDFYGVRTRAGHFLAHLSMLTAYKMQLFLYVKSCGVSTIGTMDLWAGMDAPAQMD